MKKTFVLVVIFILAISSVCFADVYVRGHYRDDGSYVESHHRSNPDGYQDNNWSHHGNSNPYTGQRGYRR